MSAIKYGFVVPFFIVLYVCGWCLGLDLLSQPSDLLFVVGFILLCGMNCFVAVKLKRIAKGIYDEYKENRNN